MWSYQNKACAGYQLPYDNGGYVYRQVLVGIELPDHLTWPDLVDVGCRVQDCDAQKFKDMLLEARGGKAASPVPAPAAAAARRGQGRWGSTGRQPQISSDEERGRGPFPPAATAAAAQTLQAARGVADDRNACLASST